MQAAFKFCQKAKPWHLGGLRRRSSGLEVADKSGRAVGRISAGSGCVIGIGLIFSTSSLVSKKQRKRGRDRPWMDFRIAGVCVVRGWRWMVNVKGNYCLWPLRGEDGGGGRKWQISGGSGGVAGAGFYGIMG